MAISIIDTLKVIQIADQNSSGNVFAMGTSDFAHDMIKKHVGIAESRQNVMRRLESHLLAGLEETIVKIEDPESGAQARFQLLRVEWFGEVIIGAGFKTCNDVFFLSPGGKQYGIYIGLILSLADFAADSGTVQLRHHPVQQSEPRSTRLAQLFGRLASVFDSGHNIASAFQSFLKQAPRHCIVVGNQNPTQHTSSMQPSSCGNNLVASLSNAATPSGKPCFSPFLPNRSIRSADAPDSMSARFESIPFLAYAP